MGISFGRYYYLPELLQLEEALPQMYHPSWPRGPTPLRPLAFARCLVSHPDRQFADFIIRGLSAGFRIGYTNPGRLRSRSRNHPSCMANPIVVDQHIARELAAGRLVGPLPNRLQEQVHTSPLGLVPKGHVAGQWRLIVDLSSPARCSVNDGISKDLCSLHYASLDEALDLIRALGPGTQLVKMDLKEAYRVVPVHPNDHHLLGVSWEGAVYVDRSLPFGLRSAPKIFTAVADAMAWALHTRGIRLLLHYLDDFLFFQPPGEAFSLDTRTTATSVFQELGVPVADHKTEGPSSRVTFLGFVIDTRAFQVSLPDDKLSRLQEMIALWQGRHGCTRRELESLLGRLSHAAFAIRPGRLFLRQLFALLPHAPQPYHHIRFNLSTRADLSWWAFLLREWNGVSLFPASSPSIHVFSDASGSYGCGAFVPDVAYFSLRWPPHWAEIDISIKELAPLVIACAIWGPTWSGQHVLFHVDNLAVVQVVQRLNARDPYLCHFLRCLYLYSAFFNFEFSATHIPGTENVAADALSRGYYSLFHFLQPQVHEQVVPLLLVTLFLLFLPDWNCPAWTAQFRLSLRAAWPHRPQRPTGVAYQDSSSSVI